MKIKRSLLFLFVLFISLMLQSCGGSGDGNTIGNGIPPKLTVTISSETVVEGATDVTGSVSIGQKRDNDLNVNLASSDTQTVTLPASVTIPAGETTATFEVTLADDVYVLALELQITVTASASGWTSGSDDLVVEDDDCDVSDLLGGTYSFEIDGDDIEDGCLGGLLEGDNIQGYLNTLTFPDIYLPAGNYSTLYEIPSPGIELPFIGFVEGSIIIGDNERLEITVDNLLDAIEIDLSLLGFPGNYSLILDVSLDEAILCSASDPAIIASFVMVIESATFEPDMPLYSLPTPCEISVMMTGSLEP